MWDIPGGGVEPGESTADAVAREFLEETGLDIPVKGIATAFENIDTEGRPINSSLGRWSLQDGFDWATDLART